MAARTEIGERNGGWKTEIGRRLRAHGRVGLCNLGAMHRIEWRVRMNAEGMNHHDRLQPPSGFRWLTSDLEQLPFSSGSVGPSDSRTSESGCLVAPEAQ